jgi:hypothetical protein
MIILFDMWTKHSIWYLFEFSNRQLSLIFLSFLCILIDLFLFLNNIPVPTYDEFLYVWFFSHCKIAESIQIFHPTIFFIRQPNFVLQQDFLLNTCVYIFYLYQFNLFVKEISIFELLSFFIQSHWHCFYSNLGICYNILLYHIYFVKQIHCINIIESFSLKSDT